jgi:hydrogenase maturation protein HypF
MKIEVTGIVQGVGFRPFVYRTAVKNRLNGYVKNKGDAGVEIILEGREQAIETFLKDLKTEAPPLAQIYDTTKRKLKGKDEYPGFTISKSSSEAEHAGSIIPPDIAICDDCLRELGDPKDPRYNYFFITCTNCGPRYTIIERLPYDRENTTMSDFPLCGFCQKAYKDPLNRRFHAQTVACPNCGPKAYLTTNKGNPVQHKDPIREAGKLLSEGNILAIKGYGGFHIAASTTDETPLARLRQTKHRSQKPFAVMARNLETIMTFAKVSKEEEQLLKSYARPIILLDKSKSYCLSDLIAPGLHNIGVMLPYTGLHHMLFDAVDDAAFVMTSANPPNQPIVKDNEEALKTLGNAVDYFLFHDRQIAHRCDDSVLRMHGKRQVFIRRSRGYAPTPIILREKTRRCIVGLGGELNDTSCILLENKAFVSPHIGDVENVETESFLRNTIEHLTRLTNSKIEAVACDLHPKFTTTKLAHQLAEENNWQLVQVQHHHAHIAALMAEHNIKEMMGICCDGYGYGTDGEAWGGEILLCTEETEGFKRLAHLEKQPLAGGDLATRYPLRVAAGILSKRMKIEDWLLENAQRFPYGKEETLILVDQLRKGFRVSETTSCGRVLDAIVAILGICYERTYEGEPAMKLESAAIDGKDVLSLEPTIENGILETTQMVYEVFVNREKYSKTDLAYSAHAYLARGLATLAIENVVKNDVKAIGFSGGAACNGILASVMRKTVKDAGLQFVVHSAVPPGDGGVSFGQAVVGGFLRHEP